MTYEERRKELLNRMEENSILVLYSGIEMHVSYDEYAPFEANRNFFYLTGLRRENMALVLNKTAGQMSEKLYIEEADPSIERWTGKMVTVAEAKEAAGIKNVGYLSELEAVLEQIMRRDEVKTAYFDTFRYQIKDLPDYNLVKANEFSNKYPGTCIRSCFPLIAEMRMQKDEEEVNRIREAIKLTDLGLQNVMKNLTPGMKEYQAQADFEYSIKYNGADSVSFLTIAGSGKNGTMLHYETNQDTCEDGTLLLLDLGAKYKGYCADITRTYPVNGKFSERQRQVYEIVLAANRKVAAEAKPGMTTVDLNEICKKELAAGCIRLGLIEKEEEIGKYYMHGVSHHLGIDVHDVTVESNKKLRPGAVITDEPGLYIDEWKIGIRIEDDLLITEQGCEVLSEAIIRTPEEIEAFMAKEKNA